MPKILTWDIEASNLDADFGYMLAFGWRYLGTRTKPVVHSVLSHPVPHDDWTRALDDNLLRLIYNRLIEADVWVTYYGKEFDLKFLKSRLLQLGMTLPPTPHVDLYFTARGNLKLSSNRLASVTSFLGLEEKTPLDRKMWNLAYRGAPHAIKYVVDHCRQDVKVLEDAYKILRPYVRQHPAVFDRGSCRSCGSDRIQSRGYATRLLSNGARPKKEPSQVRRVQCQNCGRWDLAA